jgi:hypothetical protein
MNNLVHSREECLLLKDEEEVGAVQHAKEIGADGPRKEEDEGTEVRPAHAVVDEGTLRGRKRGRGEGQAEGSNTSLVAHVMIHLHHTGLANRAVVGCRRLVPIDQGRQQGWRHNMASDSGE